MASLIETPETNSERSVDALRESVVKALCRNAGGRLTHDDVTLLLLEIR